MDEMQKRVLSHDDLPKPIGAYSHGLAIPLGDRHLIVLTGQLSLDEAGQVVSSGNAASQTERIFTSISALLGDIGADLNNLVRVVIYLTDLRDFPAVSAVRDKYLKGSRPTSTLVEVRGLVVEGCCVEIEATAII